jgi:hypothetical protein
MSSLETLLTIVATAALASAQPDRMITAKFSGGMLAPRRLNPGSSVCVNPPLNLTAMEIDADAATGELALKIREAGFRAAPLNAIKSCDATVFTEIVGISGRDRKTVAMEFRIVVAGEQIPRLCSSAHGKSVSHHEVLSGAWRAALFAAFADEARQIRDAQQKGMPIYPGAVE